MATNPTTVTSKAVRLKSPDGTYHEATAVVYTQSNGEAVFSLTKPFLDADKGLWEIFTSEQNRIADAAGNLLVLNEKIGQFKIEEVAPVTTIAGRTLYTTAAITNAIAQDSIFIDADGDIQLPTTPVDGGEIKILDPYRRIKAGKNNVLLGTDDRWLLANGTYDTTALTFTDNQLQGGSLTFKYSLPTKSWSAYATYGSPVQIGSGTAPSTGLKPAKFTGDAVLTAAPFDLIHLKGSGNIQIGTFAEGEFVDVQWDGTHDVQIIRPTGFTIHGTDDDLQLDTAQMGVNRVRLTLEGTNFEVT